MVKVPDERLAVLSGIYKPKKTTPATVEFLDLPGLSFVDEASRHEARRMIAQARQSDMLVLVLRGFHSADVAAYRDRVDPARDLDELHNEILLADLEMVSNRIDKLEKSVTKPTKTLEQEKRELELMRRLAAALEEMKPLQSVVNRDEEKLLRSFGFLTLKPRCCVVVNVDEGDLSKPAALTREQAGGEVLALVGHIEAELAALAAEERAAFLQDLGLSEIAKDRLIKTCYGALHLASFLTVGEDEVRAWTIPVGCHAVDAAGEIHSDIQRGFIRAETVAYAGSSSWPAT